MADNFDRFRSFAERYVISRAASFRVGHEEEDGYMAVLQARTIYNNIQVQSESPVVCDNRPLQDPFASGGLVGGSANSARVGGATGAMRPTPNASSQAHNNSTAAGQKLMQARALAALGAAKHHSEVTATVKSRSGGLQEMIRTIMGRESSNGTP